MPYDMNDPRQRQEYNNLLNQISQGRINSRDLSEGGAMMQKAIADAAKQFGGSTNSVVQRNLKSAINSGPVVNNVSTSNYVNRAKAAPSYVSVFQQPKSPAAPASNALAPGNIGPAPAAAPRQFNPYAQLAQVLQDVGIYDPSNKQHAERFPQLARRVLTRGVSGKQGPEGSPLSPEEAAIEDMAMFTSMLNTTDEPGPIHGFISDNIKWIVPAAATAMLGAAGMGFGMPQGATVGGGVGGTTAAGTTAATASAELGHMALAGGTQYASTLPGVAAGAGAGAAGAGATQVAGSGAGSYVDLAGNALTQAPAHTTLSTVPAATTAASGGGSLLGGMGLGDLAQLGALGLGLLGAAGGVSGGSGDVNVNIPPQEQVMPEQPQIIVQSAPAPPPVINIPQAPAMPPMPALPDIYGNAQAQAQSAKEIAKQRRKGKAQTIKTSPVGLLDEPLLAVPSAKAG